MLIVEHRLIVIGWLGSQTAYLDLSEEEARARYNKENPHDTDAPVKTLSFKDSFGVYNAWEQGS